ncbi:hypothetical protein FQN57_006657 [Myotisia sp. PD_48]|nr:hypothetical protein FQN57_006657 [Myotisia sp. PD_48]
MSPGPSFIRFWSTDLARDAVLENLSTDDLLNVRLACHEFSARAAPFLFKRIEIEFRSGTFTRPARMAALERIGHHVKSLTFKMAHSNSMFLPPLIDPFTGEEHTIVYTAQIHPSPESRLSVPKYGTLEMTDLLTKQYPPIFHAATNIPSFIRAFKSFTSLKHLTVSCPGQTPSYRYRRSAVDYALISLRIAIEQVPLKSLKSLSLLPIHPGALLYLRPNIGFGVSPAGQKRWAQIKTLKIVMNSFPFGPGQPVDQLKLIHTYLQGFSRLSRLFFRWEGEKGPCPVSLATEPCLVEDKYLGPIYPSLNQPRCRLRPLKFPSLRHIEIENAIMDAVQVSSFILEHRHTATEFNFEQTVLRSGSWDDALAPLTYITGNELWKKKQEEVMDVPLILSAAGMEIRQLQRVIMEQSKRNTRTKQFRAYSNIQRATSRTRELLSSGPDHMKRFLRASVFSWR